MPTPLRPMATRIAVEVCPEDGATSGYVSNVLDSKTDVVLAAPVDALTAEIAAGVVMGGGERASVVLAGAEAVGGRTTERALEGRSLARETAVLAEGRGRGLVGMSLSRVACLAKGGMELELRAGAAGTAAGAGGRTVVPLERFGRSMGILQISRCDLGIKEEIGKKWILG